MKIAVITTVWFPLSHADVIVTRWVRPFPTDGANGWTRPESVIASAWIEQRPATDLGVGFCADNGISLFDTIEKALTLGTGTLAVDGVMLIGEHGDYPRNELGQKLYPRKRLFDEIVRVFRASRKAVPIFNDKHFSWDFAESCEMLETARELGFPLYGGSSLPHCPLDPVPDGEFREEVREAFALYSGGADDYGFHSLEFLQSFVEKRPGGEKGVRAVRALEGQAAHDAVTTGVVPADLLLNALACHGYPATEEIIPFLMKRTEEPVLFQIEHVDGLFATHMLLPKFVSNWIVSLRLTTGEIRSHQVDIGKGGADFYRNFAFLNTQLEKFFQTGQPPTSPLRTHLVTGTLQAVLKAIKDNGSWVETPQLSVMY